MPVYNKFSSVVIDNNTEIMVMGDGSINIEVTDANGNTIDIDLTLTQLKKLVKEAEARKEMFTR